jgi:hypothetical protein
MVQLPMLNRSHFVKKRYFGLNDRMLIGRGEGRSLRREFRNGRYLEQCWGNENNSFMQDTNERLTLSLFPLY